MPATAETAEERTLVEAYDHLRQAVDDLARRDALIRAMLPIIWSVMHGNGISSEDPDAQDVVPRQAFKILRHLARLNHPELDQPLYHLVRRAAKQSGVGDYGRIRRRRARQRQIARDERRLEIAQIPERQAAIAPDASLMRQLEPEREGQLLAGVAKLGARQRWFVEQHYLRERPLAELVDELFQRALTDEPGGPAAVPEARRALLFKRARQNVYSYHRNALPRLRQLFFSLSKEDQ